MNLAAAEIPTPDGSLGDVIMLQAHVAMAGAWLLTAALVALVAVPRLRRIPSALGLHMLQTRRELVLNILWSTFLLTLATGTWLMFKQAAYDPPLSSSDFSDLESQPYGLPYYYALYSKIAIFLVMGVATLALAAEANRAARESEAGGGPVELDVDSDDAAIGTADLTESVTRTGVAARRRTAGAPVVPNAGLWGSALVLVAGTAGIGFAVTLIKYFHELSRAAVVYEQLRGR